MSKYAVVYWKSLGNDKITLKEFDDEAEMVDFAEQKKIAGYGVIVAESSHQNLRREKTYTIWHYGAYFFFRYAAVYFGVILIVLIFVLFLFLKGQGYLKINHL